MWDERLRKAWHRGLPHWSKAVFEGQPKGELFLSYFPIQEVLFHLRRIFTNTNLPIKSSEKGRIFGKQASALIPESISQLMTVTSEREV